MHIRVELHSVIFKKKKIPGYTPRPVSDADKEIPTLGSTDNAGNSVNLVSGIIRLPAGWDFYVCIRDVDDRFYLSLDVPQVNNLDSGF